MSQKQNLSTIAKKLFVEKYILQSEKKKKWNLGSAFKTPVKKTLNKISPDQPFSRI